MRRAAATAILLATVAVILASTSPGDDTNPGCATVEDAAVIVDSSCASCPVGNRNDAVDDSLRTYAVVSLPKGVAAKVRVRAERKDGAYHGGKFGAVLSASGDLDLNRDVVIRTLRRGVEGATSIGVALPANSDGKPQAMNVLTQVEFDAIEVTVTKPASRDSGELHVHAFCAS